MEIEYEVTFDDVLAFNLYSSGRLPSVGPFLRWSIGVLSVLFFVWLLVVVLPHPTPTRSFYVIFVVIYFLFLLFHRPLRRSAVKGMLKRMHRQGKAFGSEGKNRLVVTAEQICEFGPFVDTTVRWAGVTEIAATGTHAFIYFSALQAIIVPRRAFSDEPMFTAFVASLNQYRHWAPPAKPAESSQQAT